MNISAPFINKPIMTMLLTVLVTIFGISAFVTMPVSDLPVVDSPVITVTVNYPGASPSLMATAVATPLETQFMQIPGIRGVISLNTEGQSQLILTFDLNRSVDVAAPDVQAAIQNAQENLPRDLPAPPTYTKTNPSDMPIMYLVVSSDSLTPGQLYNYANRTIGNRIYTVFGVSQVQCWGAKGAIRIQVNPQKLASYKIGLNDMALAIKQATVIIPGGSLNGESRTFSIEPEGQILKAADFENVIVAYRNNAPVYIKDLATCLDSTDNDVINLLYSFEDEEPSKGCVMLAISRMAGSNTVALSKNIRKEIDLLRRELPGSVKLDIFYDKSESIVESIDDVKTTIVIALILVILVIYLFLGRMSDTIIPAVTLPLSLIMTFIIMSSMKFSLNNLSLMGLTLSIGFVVDDAIVVLENTVRLIEEGMNPFKAAIKSASEIGFTIVSMTISLAIIFVPLIFMGGVVGKTFREFAITVVVTILASGVISLTLTPMMCARMLKAKKKDAHERTKVQMIVEPFLDSVIKGYGVSLRKMLERPMITIIAWIICIAGTVFFFMVLPKSFLPEGDSGLFKGQMQAPLGTSSKQIRIFQDKVHDIVRKDPNVERTLTITGLNTGADQSTGIFVGGLKAKNKRKPMDKVVDEIRKKLFVLPDGYAYVMAIPALHMSVGGESTAAGSKYSYMMTGFDQDELYSAALKLEEEIDRLPGFVDVQNSVKLNMPKLKINLLRDRASTLGITAEEIATSLSLAYAGGKVTTYKTDLDQYNIILELDKAYQKNPEDLEQIYLNSSASDKLIPFSSIASWEKTVGPQQVPHFDQLNSATLSFNVSPDVPLGTATAALEETAERVLPPDISGRLQGEAEQFKEAIGNLGILILIAIFIKYVVLGVLYESYAHPFTILTTLPVATVGGLATLFIFGAELSIYAYVGIFMLLGIVAKNGIMMVDFANQILKEEKTTALEAIHKASVVRFRPILMTGLAAIMGALPIALGYGADGSSRIPLGLVVVGGLVFSQVVTLYVTPGLFLYMQKFQEKFLDKFELTRAGSSRTTDGE